VSAKLDPPDRVVVLRRRYRFGGGRLHLVAERTLRLRGWGKATRLSRTRCPGMGPRGWVAADPSW